MRSPNSRTLAIKALNFLRYTYEEVRPKGTVIETVQSSYKASLSRTTHSLLTLLTFPLSVAPALGSCRACIRGNQSIYIHRSGPLLENGLDRPKNRYGRYGLPSFLQHFHIYRRGGWSQGLPLKIFFSCSGWWWWCIYIYI